MIAINKTTTPTREFKTLTNREVEALRAILNTAEITGLVKVGKFTARSSVTCWELLDSDNKVIYRSSYLTDVASMMVNMESVREIIETLDPPYIETPTQEYSKI